MAIPKGNLRTPVGFNSAGLPRALEVDSKDLLKIAIGGVSSISSKGIAVSNLTLPAGSSYIESDVVPAGKIWIVSNFSISYTGTTATRIYVTPCLNGTYAIIFSPLSPDSEVYYDRQGWWVLQPGDRIRWGVYNATLGDALYGYASVCTLDLNS